MSTNIPTDSTTPSTSTQPAPNSPLSHLLDSLAAKFSNNAPVEPSKPLYTTDFLVQFRYTAENKEFCKDYCPRVFQKLRSLCGITEEEFMESLLDPNYDILGKSLGKSGSMLFRTADKKYFVKTIDRTEKTFLVSTLPAYYHYLSSNPSSFLLKIFSVFRVRLTSLKSVHFIITKNVLPPDLTVSELYDLKGSSAGRLRKEGEFIRKDLDLKRRFALGDICSDVQKQIEGDSRFLQSLGVMDYSMLLGVVRRTIERKPVESRTPPPVPPKNRYSGRHSLRVKPIARRQSVSLNTISHVLHTSETLLEAHASSTKTPRRHDGVVLPPNYPIHRIPQSRVTPQSPKLPPVPTIPSRERAVSNSATPTSSPQHLSNDSTRERSVSNSTPTKSPPQSTSSPPLEGGRVARLAKQFESLHVDTSRNHHSNSSPAPTPTSAQQSSPQVSISPQSASSTNSTSSSSSGSVTKRSPPALPKKPSHLTVRPLPNSITNDTSDSSTHAQSVPTPNDNEKKYAELKYNPSFLRKLQKQAESDVPSPKSDTSEKETKSNPITQLLNSFSFNNHANKGKKKSIARNHSERITRQYQQHAEPVQTLKSIQPKYMLTSHVSQALLRRKDIWMEGFKVRPDSWQQQQQQQIGEEFEEELFLGIIDITQQYNVKKQAALMLRSLKYDPSAQSSIEPSLYAARFQKFMSDVFVE